jgi:hypothetical protein
MSASTAMVAPPPTTQLTPTISHEQETRLLTDGVSVVARKLRSTRPFGPAARGLLLAVGVVVLAVVGVTVWRVSLSHAPPAPEATVTVPTAAETTAPPPAATTGPTARSTVSGTPAPATGAVAPVTTTLRLHANGVIASVRVNDRAVQVSRPGSTVSVQLVGFESASSLAIDAFSADGRRAAIAVPAGATDVTLDFRAASSAPPPVRGAGRAPVQASPAPAPAPTAPATAPLAPSPYN